MTVLKYLVITNRKLRRNCILQPKQRDAIDLLQCLAKLLFRCGLQPLVERSKDIVFGASFHGVKKWEAKFFTIGGVEFLQSLVFLWSEPIKSSARLLSGRGGAHARACAEVRVCAQ